VLESDLFQQVEHLFEVVVLFTRELNDHRRTEREVRDRVAQPSHPLPNGLSTFGPAHELEHAIAPLLNRHIEIWHDPCFTCDQLDQVACDYGRIHVEEAVPGHIGTVD